MMPKRALLAILIGAVLALAMTGFIAAAPAREPAGQQPGQPIVIRWSTETEINTAGFNVYRADNEDGPWSKINQRLIPGSPDPLRGGTYVFTDTQVLAGATYWYELEEVELDGRLTRLERTQATARGQLGGLPCAGGLVVAGGVGIAAFNSRRRVASRARAAG